MSEHQEEPAHLGSGAEDEDSAAPLAKSTLFQRLADRYFGYDFFISYCWADGRLYALELQRQLEEHGFNCFLDSSDYAKGDNWRAAGQRALKKTSRLILVGTPQAVLSEPVANELRIFSGLKRRVFPIDFGGALEPIGTKEGIFRYLDPDMLRVIESEDALVAGPSKEVISQIHESFDLLRQDQKRVRRFAALTGVFALVAVVALIASFLATVEKKRANEQTEVAEKKTLESLESQAESELSLANNALKSNRINEALSHLWNAYEHAPDGTSVSDSVFRILRAWLPFAGHVARPPTLGQNVILAPGGKRALNFTFGIESENGNTATATLVNTATGETMPGIKNMFISENPLSPIPAVFSPDGTFFAFATLENTIEIRSAHDGDLLKTLRLAGKVGSIAIRNEREIAVILTHDKAISLHDLKTGKKLATFTLNWDYEGDGGDIAMFSGDGKKMLAILGGSFGFWDVATKASIPLNGDLAAEGNFTNARLLTVNEDGSLFATIDNVVGQPQVWSTETGKETWNPPQIDDGYFTTDLIAFHPLVPDLAAVGFGDTVEIRELGDENSFTTWGSNRNRLVTEGMITELAFSKDGKHLITADDSPGIKILEIPVNKRSLSGSREKSMRISNDRRFGLQNSVDGPLLIDIHSETALGPKIKFLSQPAFSIGQFTVSEDRQYAAIEGWRYDGKNNSQLLAIFETKTSLPLSPGLINVDSNIDRLFFTADSSSVVGLSHQKNEIMLWESATGQPQAGIPFQLPPVKGFSDTTSLVSVSKKRDRFVQARGNEIQLWNSENSIPELMTTFPVDDNQTIDSVSISSDGTRIAVLTKPPEGKITIWSAEGKRLSQSISANQQFVHFTFSPNGSHLAVAHGSDLSFYKPSTGDRLIGPLRHSNLITDLVFSPDSKTLAVVMDYTDEGISFADVKLWDVETGIALGPQERRGNNVEVTFSKDSSLLNFTHKQGQVEKLIETRTIFSPVPPAKEDLRMTLELITGTSFLKDGTRSHLPVPAAKQRRGDYAKMPQPHQIIPQLPPDEMIAPPESLKPVLSAAEPISVAEDPVRQFLLEWIAAGNSDDNEAPPQADFYTESPLINGKAMQSDELRAGQRSFEEAFPQRTFTYLDHEILSTDSNGDVTLFVHQHVFLKSAEGEERESKVRDELLLQILDGQFKIQSRKRVDTQRLR